MDQVKQRQVSELNGALACCKTAIDALAILEITLKDDEDIVRAYGWLQFVRANVEAEIDRVKSSKADDSSPVAAPV